MIAFAEALPWNGEVRSELLDRSASTNPLGPEISPRRNTRKDATS